VVVIVEEDDSGMRRSLEKEQILHHIPVPLPYISVSFPALAC